MWCKTWIYQNLPQAGIGNPPEGQPPGRIGLGPLAGTCAGAAVSAEQVRRLSERLFVLPLLLGLRGRHPYRFRHSHDRQCPHGPRRRNQQKLSWRTPHRHRQDPELHPHHQNGNRPHRQCLSPPGALCHRNQGLRRGNAPTQPRSPRTAWPLELYRTARSECELIGRRQTAFR